MQWNDVRLFVHSGPNSLHALFDFLHTGKEDENASLGLLVYDVVCQGSYEL